MKKGHVFSLVACMALCSCGTHTSNIRQGNNVTYVSLGDQRAAAAGVRVLDATPATGGENLGAVEAGRCHRRTTETAPTDDVVLLDLKIAAYARGGDAISDVAIASKSGLTSNCWHVLEGRAIVWRLAKPES